MSKKSSATESLSICRVCQPSTGLHSPSPMRKFTWKRLVALLLEKRRRGLECVSHYNSHARDYYSAIMAGMRGKDPTFQLKVGKA